MADELTARDEALSKLPLAYSLALRLRDAGWAPEVVSACVSVELAALACHYRIAELKLLATQGLLIVH